MNGNLCYGKIAAFVFLDLIVGCVSEFESLPESIVLESDSNTILTRQDLDGLDVLFVFLDEPSLKQVTRFWHLKDFESENFKVLLTTKVHDINRVHAIKKETISLGKFLSM